MGADAGFHALFVYGVLLRRDVQADTFGRQLARTPDTLPGYRLSYAAFELPRATAYLGDRQHPVARHTGGALDKIVGEVIDVTADELDAADEFASPVFQRRRVTLGSGNAAWAYVPVMPRAIAD